jgi:hypothetical protein
MLNYRMIRSAIINKKEEKEVCTVHNRAKKRKGKKKDSTHTATHTYLLYPYFFIRIILFHQLTCLHIHEPYFLLFIILFFYYPCLQNGRKKKERREGGDREEEEEEEKKRGKGRDRIRGKF